MHSALGDRADRGLVGDTTMMMLKVICGFILLVDSVGLVLCVLRLIVLIGDWWEMRR